MLIQKKKGKKGTMTGGNKQKTNSQMAGVSPTISIITENINCLNIPILVKTIRLDLKNTKIQLNNATHLFYI